MKYLYFLIFIGFSALAQESLIEAIPKKVYSSNNIEVKSYNYEGLEKYLNLKDDKVYVINFWATWCLPCVKELPYFELLSTNYKDKKVEVILVSLDMPQKVETVLISFIQKKKLQSKVVHLDNPDANNWIEKINKNWSGAIPATIIYNSKDKKFL